jgi:hypothetical protein
VLVTSGEHYGAVVNEDFDYRRYLNELASHDLNQTRVFSGSQLENGNSVPGLGYASTLAPRPGRAVSPWVRKNGRYDLATFSQAYIKRMQDFVAAAGRRGIVVELVLFGALYDYDEWARSPFNSANNVNGVDIDASALYTLDDRRALRYQTGLARMLADKLNRFDNLYFEIINEGWAEPAYADDAWQDRIAAAIQKTESKLPNQHLIARNYNQATGPVAHPDHYVSIFNFHYQRDVSDYQDLDGVLAFDETGLQGRSDLPYRTDGWFFMLSGGGVYSNLDWSFTPTDEAGSGPVPADAPGGGGQSLRRSLGALKDFLDRFDLESMFPSPEVVTRAPSGATTRALVDPGQEYAVYLEGGAGNELGLKVPPGRYRAQWVDPRTGRVVSTRDTRPRGGEMVLDVPPYDADLALAVERRER